MTLGILDPQHIRRYGMYACLQACVGQCKDTKPSSTTSRWQLRTVLATIRPSWRSCEYHLVPPHVLWCRMHWCRALPPLTTRWSSPAYTSFDRQMTIRPWRGSGVIRRLPWGHQLVMHGSNPVCLVITATHCTRAWAKAAVSSRWLMGGFLWLAR